MAVRPTGLSNCVIWPMGGPSRLLMPFFEWLCALLYSWCPFCAPLCHDASFSASSQRPRGSLTRPLLWLVQGSLQPSVLESRIGHRRCPGRPPMSSSSARNGELRSLAGVCHCGRQRASDRRRLHLTLNAHLSGFELLALTDPSNARPFALAASQSHARFPPAAVVRVRLKARALRHSFGTTLMSSRASAWKSLCVERHRSQKSPSTSVMPYVAGRPLRPITVAEVAPLISWRRPQARRR